MNAAETKHVGIFIAAVGAVLMSLTLCFAQPVRAYADEPSADAQGDPGYVQYLSDREPSGSQVGWGSLCKDADADGRPLTLLGNGREVAYDKGLFAHAYSSIFYTDIQDYGYETFEATVGVSAYQRGTSASVEFLIYADEELVWRSGTMTPDADAMDVSIDVSGVHVLQLVADPVGSNSFDHAIWADARFSKAEPTPYLVASAKEFQTPEQVTSANILEGVFARTLSGELVRDDQPITSWRGYTLYNGKEGNDLSDEVTYTTDYTPGAVGDGFSITYRVEDRQGYVREVTVPLSVRTDEIYRLDADLEYLTTPFASFMYSGRDYFDEQGKKGFDLVVAELLKFGYNADKYPVITSSGERVARVDVNLQDAGIYMQVKQARTLTSVVMDDEVRCFHVKDWGATVTQKDGMANVVSFYVPERFTKTTEDGENYYLARLKAVEENASRFLAGIEEGMTDAQRTRAVLYPYGDWIKYQGGGQLMDEALADGQGVCGGNARGAIYLSQRMGLKSYWVRTGSHAWSMVKLNDMGEYYRVDLLARPGCFLSVDGGDYTSFHGHHDQINFNRSLGYPDVSLESFPFEHTAWPNMQMQAAGGVTVLVPSDYGSFDPRSLLTVCTSIYDGDKTADAVIDDGGLEAGVVDGKYTEGYYRIEFSVTDSRGNTATADAHVQVVGEGDDVTQQQHVSTSGIGGGHIVIADGSTATKIELWTGTAEQVYDRGLIMYDDEFITYDVKGKGYTYFDAWVGINGSVRDNVNWGKNGKVQLEVVASVRNADGTLSDVLIAQSPIMGWYAVQHHILVEIPANAESITLRNVSKGAGNGHAGWGNPRFLSDDVLNEIPTLPVVSNVEDGGVYEEGVAPTVANADRATLYWKDFPTVVDPGVTGDGSDAGEGTPAAYAASSFAEEDGYGAVVEGWTSGAVIDTPGLYTLVAAKTLVSGVEWTTVVSFQVGEAQVVEPESPVDPEGEFVFATAQQGVVSYGDQASFDVVVLDSNRVGVQGEAVGLVVATTGEVLARGVTDAEGNAVLSFDTAGKVLNIGAHDIEAVLLDGDGAATPVVSQAMAIEIAPRELAIEGLEVKDKVADGATSVVVDASGVILAGVVGDDEVSFSFEGAEAASAEPGKGIAVILRGLALAGADAAWYTLSAPELSVDIIDVGAGEGGDGNGNGEGGAGSGDGGDGSGDGSGSDHDAGADANGGSGGDVQKGDAFAPTGDAATSIAMMALAGIAIAGCGMAFAARRILRGM